MIPSTAGAEVEVPEGVHRGMIGYKLAGGVPGSEHSDEMTEMAEYRPICPFLPNALQTNQAASGRLDEPFLP